MHKINKVEVRKFNRSKIMPSYRICLNEYMLIKMFSGHMNKLKRWSGFFLRGKQVTVVDEKIVDVFPLLSIMTWWKEIILMLKQQEMDFLQLIILGIYCMALKFSFIRLSRTAFGTPYVWIPQTELCEKLKPEGDNVWRTYSQYYKYADTMRPKEYLWQGSFARFGDPYWLSSCLMTFTSDVSWIIF